MWPQPVRCFICFIQVVSLSQTLETKGLIVRLVSVMRAAAGRQQQAAAVDYAWCGSRQQKMGPAVDSCGWGQQKMWAVAGRSGRGRRRYATATEDVGNGRRLRWLPRSNRWQQATGGGSGFWQKMRAVASSHNILLPSAFQMWCQSFCLFLRCDVTHLLWCHK